MRIAMVSSEINPLAKSGGLADVVYSLAKELIVTGEEVICVLPYYKSIKDNATVKVARIGHINVFLSWRKQRADIYKTYYNGILFYLIDNPYYFGRDGLYGFYDDAERFAFFTLATASLFSFVRFKPDIIHLHDWQPGMLPVIGKRSNDPYLNQAKYVFTIHNEDFKGYFDRFFLNDFYNLPDSLFDDGSVRFDGQVSSFKAALVFSDFITTVSPTHANELLTPEGSKGIHAILEGRRNDYAGIVNGIDEGEWNPLEDPFIQINYDAKTQENAKKACKKHLLSYFGIGETEAPVFGLVSRLTYQKGVELICQEAKNIVTRGGILIVLGAGEYGLEEWLEGLGREFPGQVGFYRGYSSQMAHDIYSGADFFLMPSLFEPCGIGQMIAQRYGCLPIVREVGGLKDTVVGYDGNNKEDATGFTFRDYDLNQFDQAIQKAEDVYRDKNTLNVLISNAMNVDHGWPSSCKQYLALYERLVAGN